MAKLTAKPREKTGSRASRALRSEGLIPAIIYGHGETPQAITLSEHEIEVAILHGERVLEMDIEGKDQNVLIKDVQWDLFGHAVLHVDLTRVNLDEQVEVSVPILLRGTPEGQREGGVLNQLLDEITVSCLVRSIPEEIEYNIHDMQVDDQVFLRDLELPEGVKLIDDPDELLCQLTIVEEAPEVEEEEGAEDLAEPEVIGEAEAEEGEGEEGGEE
jgi:large subunit ribosomal protein L25